MGSNHSKPETTKKKKKANHGGVIQPKTAPPANAHPTPIPPTTLPPSTDNTSFSDVIDYGLTASFAGTPGIHSLPPTPLAPYTPAMPALAPSTTAPPRLHHVHVHELEGHSNVSRPLPPPARLRHLSELIDPADLPRNAHVRSPSGNILDAEEFAAHPDRPRSLRERREEILRRVRAASAAAAAAEGGAGVAAGGQGAGGWVQGAAGAGEGAAGGGVAGGSAAGGGGNVQVENVRPTPTAASTTTAAAASKGGKAKKAKKGSEKGKKTAWWKRCFSD